MDDASGGTWTRSSIPSPAISLASGWGGVWCAEGCSAVFKFGGGPPPGQPSWWQSSALSRRPERVGPGA